MENGQTKRKLYEVLRAQLENERSSFVSHWRDLNDYILPRRARFFTQDVNRGDRRNQKIIDSTATLAARTLRSGMMGGVTSPARPWFRLTTPDSEMAEFGPVKEWLHVVGQRMADVFLRSNIYNSLPIVYGDMGVFGTAAMLLEEDFEDVIRTYPFAVGSYMLANDEKLRVRVFYRDFQMTVRQLVMKFGEYDEKTGRPMWEKFSSRVKELWNKGHYEEWIEVCHVIQPNQEYNPKYLASKYKKFSSCYFEKGFVGKTSYNTNFEDRFLRESGYDYFPVLAPRWEVNGEDVYGTDCPGMTALGDIKQLQVEQKRKAQGIEKGINPAMVGPTSLKTAKATILPGDITFIDEREGQKGFRAAHEVNLDLQHLLLDIQSVQNIIKKSFFEDLFLMLSTSDRREITAREIEERHEEKLLALGPVLEQLNQDLLDPLIANTFQIMVRQSDFRNGTGPIPRPPDELMGSDLKVEYISVMAQAQKLVGISSIERFAGFVGNIAERTQDPSVLDKIDLDQLIDEHGNATGVPPRIIRSDEAVAEIRAQRAKQQQVAQQMAAIEQGAKAAKNLSGADMESDNALTRMVKGAAA